jgi:ketosteroid isomerase-like protein
MKFLFTIMMLSSVSVSVAQDRDKQEILRVLDNQIAAWNSGNLDSFMVGYWNNDSLMFIGSRGLTYGYTNTLNNYKKGYKDTTEMGKLKFTILEVKRIAADAFFVVGKWQLLRTIGNLDGHYSLVFRRIKGKWLIVADHSS